MKPLNFEKLLQTAISTNHNERREIIVSLCQDLYHGLLSVNDLETQIQPDTDLEIVRVVCEILSDDMRISKQFRYNQGNNLAVYTAIIKAMLGHHGQPTYNILLAALRKLEIISPLDEAGRQKLSEAFPFPEL